MARIGPCMAIALSLCDRPGGMALIDLAYSVGPHRSLGYGYQSVKRLIRTGLVITGRAQEKGRRGLLVCSLGYNNGNQGTV